jgi:3-deoxy-manno-octulosonate cytidylyltransferase (CMP-KDO synthetase)
MTLSAQAGKTAAVIPARYQSSRFPGKPLARETGKPLIQHVVEQVRHSKLADLVLVATDDQRIFDAVESFGAKAVMTHTDHPNGTSRIAQAIENLPAEYDLIVNVQGDEPEIEPHLIDLLIERLRADTMAPMATLASPFANDENPADPNIVKLVVNRRGHAMYFSRSLIPFDRDGMGHRPLKHPGMYAYRRSFLMEYVQLPPSPLEQLEQLEQLRALENGYPIAVVQTVVRHHGIDTPQQYAEFVRRVMGTSTNSH